MAGTGAPARANTFPCSAAKDHAIEYVAHAWFELAASMHTALQSRLPSDCSCSPAPVVLLPPPIRAPAAPLPQLPLLCHRLCCTRRGGSFSISKQWWQDRLSGRLATDEASSGRNITTMTDVQSGSRRASLHHGRRRTSDKVSLKREP
eukprot:365942-Chlamydomonas_euryale.AAC.51